MLGFAGFYPTYICLIFNCTCLLTLNQQGSHSQFLTIILDIFSFAAVAVYPIDPKSVRGAAEIYLTQPTDTTDTP
jgi:hypothetical protein